MKIDISPTEHDIASAILRKRVKISGHDETPDGEWTYYMTLDSVESAPDRMGQRYIPKEKLVYKALCTRFDKHAVLGLFNLGDERDYFDRVRFGGHEDLEGEIEGREFITSTDGKLTSRSISWSIETVLMFDWMEYRLVPVEE